MSECNAFFVGEHGGTEHLGAVDESNVAKLQKSGVHVHMNLSWLVNNDFVVNRSPLVQLNLRIVHLTERNAVKLHSVSLVTHYVHCNQTANINPFAANHVNALHFCHTGLTYQF